MSYTLIGSLTSPFVRRIRMLMENIPYELKEIDIFNQDGMVELNTMNPVNQIPVLIDGENKIWDSRQIFNYLNLLHKLHNMDWEDENLLTVIDGAMNSGVALILLKRSGVDINQPMMYVDRQKRRIESVLDYLKPFMQKEGLNWNFHSMSLYAFLDWAQFRQITNLQNRPECLAFLRHHADRSIVQKTAIPKG
jgi:glutathione S-transferase